MRNIIRVIMLVVALALIFINTRPNTLHIERATTIAATSDVVFSKINNFHEWAAWSPWEHLDPNMQKSFEGSDSGVGAGYHWSGNAKAGEGRMTITESQPNQRVGIKLEFIKPFQATNATSFILTPDGAGTKVTWTMDGPLNFMSKVMCLFQSMDKMIGPDFEKGLTGMKSLAESDAKSGAASDSTHASGKTTS